MQGSMRVEQNANSLKASMIFNDMVIALNMRGPAGLGLASVPNLTIDIIRYRGMERVRKYIIGRQSTQTKASSYRLMRYCLEMAKLAAEQDDAPLGEYLHKTVAMIILYTIDRGRNENHPMAMPADE